MLIQHLDHFFFFSLPVVEVLEHATQLMDTRGVEANPSGKWVWVIDFEGYSLGDNNPKTTLMAAKLLDQYPERLGLSVMFGAPWLFGAVWKVVRPLLNEVTTEKVCFLEGGMSKREKWQPLLGEHFDAELLEWMTREFEENRQSSDKQYW